MGTRGVFAIETTDWWSGYREPGSVSPMFDLLAQGVDPRPTIVHRRAATREELRHHLGRWRRTRSFPILYLGFHGAPGRIFLGNDRRKRAPTVTLDDIGAMLGSRCRGRIVHIGACSTLDLDRRRVQRFLRRTGMLAVTGYQRDLDWLKATALEALILEMLLRYRLTLDGARRLERAFRRETPFLRRELAFRMVIRER